MIRVFLLFWKAKAPLNMSAVWLTVLKSRKTRLALMMVGWCLLVEAGLTSRGEQKE